MIDIITDLSSAKLKRVLNRQADLFAPEEDIVKKIIENVKKNGDKALIKYSKDFDKVKLSSKDIKLKPEQINQQALKCPAKLKVAINEAIKNITEYHKHQHQEDFSFSPSKGINLGQKVLPIENVGLYIPGGSAPLFSTILMTAIPAQIAGVKNISAITPPVADGLFPPMAYAFKKLKIENIYFTGGAQAIAALTFGTNTIKKVDKIVGPGSIYVSLAKKLLYGVIDIDMVAGPSEICIIADKSCNPEFVASDLLSQAEHGTGKESAILLTNSIKIAKAVQSKIKILLTLKVPSIGLKTALKKQSAIIVLKDLNECIEYANRIAPEHLELMIKYPRKTLQKIRNAGAVFLGNYSCESIGDYFAGPNHVLPTNGTARFYSPLSVYHFLKRMSVIEYSKNAIKKQGDKIQALADSEGLFFHSNSVKIRCK